MSHDFRNTPKLANISFTSKSSTLLCTVETSASVGDSNIPYLELVASSRNKYLKPCSQMPFAGSSDVSVLVPGVGGTHATWVLPSFQTVPLLRPYRADPSTSKKNTTWLTAFNLSHSTVKLGATYFMITVLFWCPRAKRATGWGRTTCKAQKYYKETDKTSTKETDFITTTVRCSIEQQHDNILTPDGPCNPNLKGSILRHFGTAERQPQFRACITTSHFHWSKEQLSGNSCASGYGITGDNEVRTSLNTL